MEKRIYFLAILPPEPLAQKVKEVQNDIANNYGSKEAYKRPAHFTLIAPFKIPEKREEGIIPPLKAFADQQRPFTIQLNNFNHFDKRVIYIDVEDPTKMQQLQKKLRNHMIRQMDFSDQDVRPKELTPHMTVAFRDLSAENFQKAWKAYQHRTFSSSFTANTFHLLKHDNKQWHPFFEFNLAKGKH